MISSNAMSETGKRLALSIGLAFVSYVVSRALLEVAHSLGWYPEQELAGLLLSSSHAWKVDWIRWTLIGAMTIALWAVADYWFYRRSSRTEKQPFEPLGPDSQRQAPEPDIDGRAAFFRILESSQWRADQDARTDARGLVHNWREVRLSDELHKRLRSGQLTSWGEECLPGTNSTPEKPIPPETWDRVAIHFDRTSAPRTAAHFKGRTRRELGDIAWVAVKFSGEQLFELFPLRSASPIDRIPMPELLKIAT
jgi:hypothetical protein